MATGTRSKQGTARNKTAGSTASSAASRKDSRTTAGGKTPAKRTPRKAAVAELPEHKRMEAMRRGAHIANERARRERTSDYHKAYAALARAARPSRRMGVGAAAKPAPPPLRLAAEGDSWFNYPPHIGIDGTGGVIGQLAKRLGIPILNLADPGDEARYMLGEKQRRRIRKLFTGPDRPDAFFFSGGGNDVAGEPLILWLRDRAPGMKPKDALDPARFGALLDLTLAAYDDLRRMRNALAPKCVLFLHSYDFALPNGKGVCGLGPWLKPSLDARGWQDFDEAKAVVRALLGAFHARLATFAAADPAGTVLVKTQGLLTEDQWDNELHPTQKGFRVVARAFEEAVRAKLALPMPSKAAAPAKTAAPAMKVRAKARAGAAAAPARSRAKAKAKARPRVARKV